MEAGQRVVIEASQIEFNVEGNTIWIHGMQGGTIIRIKTCGKIFVDQCNTSPNSHTDVVVEKDINFCLSGDVVAQ